MSIFSLVFFRATIKSLNKAPFGAPYSGVFLVAFGVGLKYLLMWSFAGPGAAAFLDLFC